MTTDAVHPPASALLARVVCGVDRTPASLQAAALAARLTPADGALRLVHVADLAAALDAPWPPDAAALEHESGAVETLEPARRIAEIFHPVSVEILFGHPASRLLTELRDARATLAVVGAHRSSRALGIMLGSVATRVVHGAPCSVLVVRNGGDPARWPHRIVVGHDGSQQAAAALAGAELIAANTGASVEILVATGGKHAHGETVPARAAVSTDGRQPVDALIAASRDASLVVVGSRGLHGTAALGSVSERVAHGAACPVLVVR
jgi:nucleotide-binding universal stress UspA family protein